MLPQQPKLFAQCAAAFHRRTSPPHFHASLRLWKGPATESDTTPGITLTPSSLNTTEGGNATYTIKLNTAPTHDVTITVAAGTDSDDDTDITIKDTDDGLDGDQTTAIVFTSTNYNTARTITLAAATDADTANGSRAITHTAASSDTNYSGVTVTLTATESDTTAGLTSSGVTATGATLTIAGHTAAWWYKSATTCTSVAANTSAATLTTLTPGASYTFTAYSDATCATSLASAAAFTTGGVSVSNMSQSADGSSFVGEYIYGDNNAGATSFTIPSGSNDYLLHSVTAKFWSKGGNPPAISATIHENSGSVPGTAVSGLTLTGLANPNNQDAVYTCSGECELSASSTYNLVFSVINPSSNYYRWRTASANGQTTTPSDAGWSIGDYSSRKVNNGGWSALTSNSDPEQYLPAGPEAWRGRIADLVQELRNPELEPCSGHLYRQEENGPLTACVEGVINEMAIRGGLPAFWFDFEDDDNATVWDAEQPDRDGTEPFGYRFVDATNVAIPEALLYHGLSVEEGRHVVDILECDGSFIRAVINDKHGVTMGADALPSVNDRLLKDGANPLHVMADVLEHLLEKPAAGSWHPRVNQWA